MSKYHKRSKKRSFDSITKERLELWRQRLREENATPVFMLSVGHERNQGKIIISCTENRTDQELLLFLEKSIQMLKAQIIQSN